MILHGWNSPSSDLIDYVTAHYDRTVSVYQNDQTRIEEDLKREISIAEGGYGRKQIQELIQNGADALQGTTGKISIRLLPDCLYVANQGLPFSERGLRGILYTHLSDKSADQIGRFGLGFKSIRGISSAPAVYSQSVSFQFSQQETAEQLTEALGRTFSTSEVPGLRLAWPVENPANDLEQDRHLRELAKWATTIVKVPLINDSIYNELKQEIDSFDESFCLFAPQVTSLVFEIFNENDLRSFVTFRTGNRVSIKDQEGKKQDWIVVSENYRPSDFALESAGNSARRDIVTVSWAMPLIGRAGVGQLCAYFPVKSDVTLSGRLNAPWKLSDDRMNIIESEFNREILENVVPRLVGEAKGYLVNQNADGSKSFGRYIDALPARGREARSWADEVINEPIYRHLRSIRSLPNADGEWRSPNQLKLMPEVALDFIDIWMESASCREDWVHPDCSSSKERRSKVLRLQNRDSDTGRGEHIEKLLVTKWLEDIVRSDSENPKRSAAAIRLVSSLHEVVVRNSNHIQEASNSRVVLLEDSTLVAPKPGNCFIKSNKHEEGSAFIDTRISNDPLTLRALENLQITPYTDNGDLYLFLQNLTRETKIDWNLGWQLMRGAPLDKLKNAIDSSVGPQFKSVCMVKNLAGDWVSPKGLFRPADTFVAKKEDGPFLIDNVFHAADTQILKLLDVHNTPQRGVPPWNEKWGREYRNFMFQFLKSQGLVVAAFEAQINYGSDDMRIGPLDCLSKIGRTNNLSLTKDIIQRAQSSVNVTYRGKTLNTEVLSPELWWLKQHGLVESSLGVVPITEAYVLQDDSEDVSNILPVANLDLPKETLEWLKIGRDISDLSVDDFRELPSVHRKRDDEKAVAETYSWWCLLYPDETEKPDHLMVKLRDEWIECEPSQVAVTTDELQEQEMESLGYPSITVPSTTDSYNLEQHWHLLPAHKIPKEVHASSTAEASSLVHLFPALEDVAFEYEELDRLELQVCESLYIESSILGQAKKSMDVRCVREGSTLYTLSRTREEQLRDVLQILEIDSSPEEVNMLLESSDLIHNNEIQRELKSLNSDIERIYKFAGEERLLALLPDPATEYLKTFHGEVPSGLNLAEMCVRMFGAATLERVCKIRSGEGLKITPPKKWQGSYDARRWVTNLGFPESWAGLTPLSKPSASESVSGPAKLSELHEYQREVSIRLKSMFGPEGPNRGFINLPTGAGKTRVAVQTIIESISDGILMGESKKNVQGPILWITDSEELCEQAIDAWKYLWRAYGRENTPLVVSRHFAGYYAKEDTSGVQVVVATYQTTAKTVDNSAEYDWMRNAPLVVIDEAHGAISPSYTKILEWTGRSSRDHSKLLLGLSATPFRGSGDSQSTERLRKRFDENMLADGVFGELDPLQWLQEHHVLADVQMRIIRSEQPDLELTDKEEVEFREKHWLPSRHERALGEQSNRTRKIVESIKSLPSDWPILVFAASVGNAETLAALLTLEGIPASAINSTTPSSERKLAIERFKTQDLRVLTNYAVLSQGFDAPQTRAVYITRPVQSAVRYQQMIGRGLRGPKNGGTDEVLIVNLLDNIRNFETSISYQDFNYLVSGNVEEI